jgi:hypothetical protein
MFERCPFAFMATIISIGFILLDVMLENYDEIPEHILISLFIILLFLILCTTEYSFIGWLLVIIPMIVFLFIYIKNTKETAYATPIIAADINPYANARCIPDSNIDGNNIDGNNIDGNNIDGNNIDNTQCPPCPCPSCY